MGIKTVLEWFHFADSDFDSANILNRAYRKHNAIICYHCQQAVKEYLNAYLCYNKLLPPKADFLEKLCEICSRFDSAFNDIAKDCAYLSPFAVHAHYPLEVEITSANTIKALEIANRIKDFSPIAGLKAKLANEVDLSDQAMNLQDQANERSPYQSVYR